MSDRHFVDTNVLMYAHDASAGPKHERARALVQDLWRDRSGVLSTQVLQELCVNLRRKAGRPVNLRTAREIITDYLTWDMHVNTGTDVLEAMELEERYRISFWDALIVQAAEAAGAKVVYSEDLSDRQEYGTVRVMNPFRE